MWHARTEPLDTGSILKYSIDENSSPLSYVEAMRLLRDNSDFRTFFTEMLGEAPFASLRWETPPVTTATGNRLFEFILIDSPELITEPDPRAFADHFSSAATNESVVVFSNLGKNAMLVVPRPIAPNSAYGHIATFVREAPRSQVHSLWKAVGMAMGQQMSQTPIWLNTAGAGVPWLHVRLDTRPKYYRYAPYRREMAR